MLTTKLGQWEGAPHAGAEKQIQGCKEKKKWRYHLAVLLNRQKAQEI
jgi:hypothetical protein